MSMSANTVKINCYDGYVWVDLNTVHFSYKESILDLAAKGYEDSTTQLVYKIKANCTGVKLTVHLATTDSTKTEQYTGGSSDYYKVAISTPTTEGTEPYVAECNDIIEALELTFAEANIFKAIWRTAAERTLGKKKKGNNALYDAEKIVFFAGRHLIQTKQKLGEK